MSNPNFHRGFTLVETLVAITVLLIGVLGPLTIAANGIADGMFVKNQITANYLAQEGLDKLINLRDQNVLTHPSDEFTGFPGAAPCQIEANLAYNNSNKIFDQSGTDSTKFTRTTCVTGSDPAWRQVVVTIAWQNKTLPKTLILASYLYER